VARPRKKHDHFTNRGGGGGRGRVRTAVTDLTLFPSSSAYYNLKKEIHLFQNITTKEPQFISTPSFIPECRNVITFGEIFWMMNPSLGALNEILQTVSDLQGFSERPKPCHCVTFINIRSNRIIGEYKSISVAGREVLSDQGVNASAVGCRLFRIGDGILITT